MSTPKRERLWNIGKWDFRVVRALLVVAVIAAMAYLVVPIWDLIKTRTLAFSFPVAEQPETTTKYAGATGKFSGDAVWTIANPTAVQIVGSLISPLLGAAVIVICVVLLWKLVSRVQQGNTFTRETLTLVRWLGAVAFLYALCGWLVRVVCQLLVMGTMEVSPHGGSFVLAFWRINAEDMALIAGAGVLMLLAEVFRIGLQQAEDVEGLI